jgi:non-specific serine/threonine protein kinase
MPNQIQHFYIPEDQSIYLLSSKDAQKLKDWLALCAKELSRLGYRNIKLIGKGAFGFAFAGIGEGEVEYVFKFSRIDLPTPVQDRLSEEAEMLSMVEHPAVPKFIAFEKLHGQSILVMERAPGIDLEAYSLRYGRISAQMAVSIILQLLDIFAYLHDVGAHKRLQIHGDIKPSNIMWDEDTKQIALIDWGSSVYAQCDLYGHSQSSNVMDLLSQDQQQTNARLGDVYFIGQEQLQGDLSSPIFDYQGLASTIYALCSAQSARFGHQVITPKSLGLPKVWADVLEALFDSSPSRRSQGIEYLNKHRFYLANTVFHPDYTIPCSRVLDLWFSDEDIDIETVVYSSRKSFLREESALTEAQLNHVSDAQFERYYKQYLQGMGDTEKAFITAVSRLGKYPLVGGLVLRWEQQGIALEANLTLMDKTLSVAVEQALENVITLARAIRRQGVFKACLFDAKATLHFERQTPQDIFTNAPAHTIPFTIKALAARDLTLSQHSYFEDGEDPDEYLSLPLGIEAKITELNQIHHCGCIIFEVLPLHMKIHSSLILLEPKQAARFSLLLDDIINMISDITDMGIAGFMKLPYKDTRHFSYQSEAPTYYHPRNAKAAL